MGRVARGSGVQPEELDELLMQYQKLSQMVKKMGGMKSLFNNPNMDMNSLAKGTASARQMQQLQGEMAKVMDPRILQQMGGMGGLPNMKGMNMKNMQSMMKNFMK